MSRTTSRKTSIFLIIPAGLQLPLKTRSGWEGRLLAAALLVFNASGLQGGSAAEKPVEVQRDAATREGEPFKQPWTFVYPAAGYRVRIPALYEQIRTQDPNPVSSEWGALLLQDARPGTKGLSASVFVKRSGIPAPRVPDPTFMILFSEGEVAFKEALTEEQESVILKHLTGQPRKPIGMHVASTRISGRHGLCIEVTQQGASEKRRISTFLVSGRGRTYEITFRFHISQENEVSREKEWVRKSFLLDGDLAPETLAAYQAGPAPGAASERVVSATGKPSPWIRVAYWTVGSFFAGILLHLILKSLWRWRARS